MELRLINQVHSQQLALADDAEKRIESLYHEKCEVLIKLRTFQAEGHDFEFDTPACDV